MRVLIQRTDRVGDLILTFPLIEAIKAVFPSCEVGLLVGPLGDELACSHDRVAYVFRAEFDSHQRITNWSALKNAIFTHKFTHYIDLHSRHNLSKLAAECQIPIRIGYRYFGSRITHVVPTLPRLNFSEPICHQLESNWQFLSKLCEIMGAQPPTTAQLGFPVRDSIVKDVQNAWAQWRTDNRESVFMFYGSGGSNCPIPSSSFVATVGELSKTYDVVVGCGVDSVPPMESLPNVLVLPNSKSICELAAWISVVDYYIGPDTGPTHISSFLNKPTLAVFSKRINPPCRWGPISSHFHIIRTDLHCKSTCFSVCETPPRCAAVTDTQLIAGFHSLQHLAKNVPAFQWPEMRHIHLKSSFRILDVDGDPIEIQQIRDCGIEIFLHKKKGIFQFWYFINILLRSNISIVLGVVFPWTKVMIWVIVHLIYQRPIPMFLKKPDSLRSPEAVVNWLITSVLEKWALILSISPIHQIEYREPNA